MARMWTASMDSQVAATEWQGTINSAPVFSTTTKVAGAASARFNPSAAGRQIYKSVYAADDAAAQVFLRAYVYVASAPSATTALMCWSDNIATSPSGFYGIKMTAARTLIITSSTGTTGTASSAIPLNTWTRIELAYNDTANTAIGYINGTTWATLTGADLGGGRYARFGIVNPATADVYLDEIAVNDASGATDNGLPGALATITRRAKVWNGSSWAGPYPVKVWDGSAWVEKQVKTHNGSTWT